MKLRGFVSGILCSVFFLCIGAHAMILSSPLDYQVFQRSNKSSGSFVIAGQLSEPALELTKIQVKLGPRQPAQSDKRVLTLGVVQKGESHFNFKVRHFSGGWHRLDVRAVAGEKIVGQAVVEHFGIGEVFVIAGQSNSANHGEQDTMTGSL